MRDHALHDVGKGPENGPRRVRICTSGKRSSRPEGMDCVVLASRVRLVTLGVFRARASSEAPVGFLTV